MRRPPSAEKLQAQVDAFNAKVKATTTQAEAYVLSGHSAVVMLEGIRGCYLLDRVTPGGFKGGEARQA